MTPLLLVASTLLAAEQPLSDLEPWPVPVAECLLALDHLRPASRQKAARAIPFAVIQRSASTLATDCGGERRPKVSCSAECLGFCLMEGSFLPGHPNGVVLVGAMDADRNEIWILERHGDGFRMISKVTIPSGRPVLIPATQGRRFADVQAHIDGIAPPELKLERAERVAFFLLLWRPASDGWEGSLYAVVLETRTATLRLQYVLPLEA